MFYNGEEKQPERRILKLSDAYEIPTENPKLELIATMLNINVGYNKELMEQCRTLRDYAAYVDRVRTYSRAMPIEKAVERAVNECIKDGILKEFLLHQKSEVLKMSIYEFDQELHNRTLLDEGIEQGIAVGRREGSKRMAELTKILLLESHMDELNRALEDSEYCEELFMKYNI